jgi:nucleotide-binding universal stress UspA family protein
MTAPIVVGIDLNEPEEGRDALLVGDRLAAALGDRLLIVNVFAPADGDARAECRAREQALLGLLEHANVLGAAAAFPGGSAALVLQHLGDRDHAAALVIGSGHAGHAGRTALGPVGEALLHGSMVPVVVAPRGYRPDSGSLARVGVAYGGTPESDDALRRGRELAGAVGARFTVIAAKDPPPMGEAGVAADRLERALAWAGDAAAGVIAEGDTAEALAAASKNLDLLVVGSRSYGPLRAVLLGAVTRRLLRMARCPIMVVPRLPDAAHEVALVGGMAVGLDL